MTQISQEEAAAVRAASRTLTDEIRRVLHRMVVVRPDVADLESATEAMRAFGDRLDQLKERAWSEVSEAGLNPRDFVERSPLSGPCNAIAPPMVLRIVGEEAEQSVEAEVSFGQAYEGPPGHVHGGFIAAMFDELLGYAQLAPGYTGRLTVNYKLRTPLDRRLTLKARVDREEGRKRWVTGECYLDGEVLTTAEGLFISPRPEHYPDGQMGPFLPR